VPHGSPSKGLRNPTGRTGEAPRGRPKPPPEHPAAAGLERPPRHRSRGRRPCARRWRRRPAAGSPQGSTCCHENHDRPDCQRPAPPPTRSAGPTPPPSGEGGPVAPACSCVRFRLASGEGYHNRERHEVNTLAGKTLESVP
jgi:hypothetical protein